MKAYLTWFNLNQYVCMTVYRYVYTHIYVQACIAVWQLYDLHNCSRPVIIFQIKDILFSFFPSIKPVKNLPLMVLHGSVFCPSEFIADEVVLAQAGWPVYL